MKRIIMIKGPVETLSYFSMQLGKAFEKYGLEIWYFDMSDPAKSRQQMEKLSDLSKSVLLTFNFIGLSGEGQFTANDQSIWDFYKIEKICIMVDHPLYYYNQLPVVGDSTTLFCIDRDHVKYIQKYYGFEAVKFLPLAGTALNESAKERDIDILFAGNYVRLDVLKARIDALDEDNREYCYRVIDELINNPCESMEQAIIRNLLIDIPEATTDDILLVSHKMMIIDLYVRSYFRRKIICDLAEAGFKITVIGKDWEFSGCKRMDNLELVGQQDSLTCLQYMERAKITLNIMPWFKAGAHDRIFNGMAQKSVVVSDSSRYLDELLEEEVHFFKYELDNLEKLPEIINKALEKYDIISNMGYEEVCKAHLWEHRAKDILKERGII